MKYLKMYRDIFFFISTHQCTKFLDAGIQDVSMSISIVHDLREISPEDDDDDDESDKHI